MATKTQYSALNAAATGAGTAMQVDDRVASSAVFQLTGTFVATVTWQGTVDGTNWSSVVAVDLSSATSAASSTATAPGMFRIDTTGLTAVRPNVTAYTSGTVVGTGTVVQG